MNVSLTPHFENFIQTLVGTGKYHSSSEVIRDALRLLQEREELKLERQAALAKLLKEGEESGEAEELDVKSFLAEANARYQRAKK